jgi:sec-independent protein translocase protein TatB
MFDFSWSEILLIGVVALVVIGPKDLPRVLRTVGKWTGRARAVAREFQMQIDQMVRESELDEVRRNMEKAVSDPHSIVKDMVDPTGEIAKAVSDPVASVATETPTHAAIVTSPAAAIEAAPVAPAMPETSTSEVKSGTHG